MGLTLVPSEKIIGETFYDLNSFRSLIRVNTKEICKVLDIDISTFNEWLLTEEGKETLDRVKERLDLYLDAALTKIISKTIYHLNERLDKGDPVFEGYDEAGKAQWLSKPLSANVLTKVFSAVFDRRELIRKKPKKEEEKEEEPVLIITPEEKTLEDLASTLDKYAQRMVSVNININSNEELPYVSGSVRESMEDLSNQAVPIRKKAESMEDLSDESMV